MAKISLAVIVDENGDIGCGVDFGTAKEQYENGIQDLGEDGTQWRLIEIELDVELPQTVKLAGQVQIGNGAELVKK